MKCLAITKKLMTIQSKNFFEVLGLEEKLQIDPKVVQKKFYEISRKTHPDYHQTSINKDLSQEYTAIVNQAFQTLKNKDKRLIYVVEQYLGPMDQQADRKNAPKELLVELIDMQEALYEYKEEPSEKNKAKLEQLILELDDKIEAYDRKIEDLIPTFDQENNFENKKRLITNIRDLSLTKNYVKSLKQTFQQALEPSEF